MIIVDYASFAAEVKHFVETRLPDPVSHKSTAVFEVGEPLIGLYVHVDRHGWHQDLDGVNVHRQRHIASPLGNLQAFATFLNLL